MKSWIIDIILKWACICSKTHCRRSKEMGRGPEEGKFIISRLSLPLYLITALLGKVFMAAAAAIWGPTLYSFLGRGFVGPLSAAAPAPLLPSREGQNFPFQSIIGSHYPSQSQSSRPTVSCSSIPPTRVCQVLREGRETNGRDRQTLMRILVSRASGQWCRFLKMHRVSVTGGNSGNCSFSILDEKWKFSRHSLLFLHRNTETTVLSSHQEQKL